MSASSRAHVPRHWLSGRRQRQPSMLGLWPSLSFSKLVAFQQIGSKWVRFATRLGRPVLFHRWIQNQWPPGKNSHPSLLCNLAKYSWIFPRFFLTWWLCKFTWKSRVRPNNAIRKTVKSCLDFALKFRQIFLWKHIFSFWFGFGFKCSQP